MSTADHPEDRNSSSASPACSDETGPLGGPPLDEERFLHTPTFRIRPAPKRRFVASAGWHEVEFGVTMAMAVPDQQQQSADWFNASSRPMTDQRPSSTEGGPRAQTFYHVEYRLFPDDSDPVRTDVVFYGHAAKIFPDRGEAMAVKTWARPNSGGEIWIAWRQTFSVRVNNDLLGSMTRYQMTVRVWDSKEKCSSRSRFDRPKPFRFPVPAPGQDPDSIGGVRNCVLRFANEFGRIPGSQLYNSRPLPRGNFAPASHVLPRQAAAPLQSKTETESKRKPIKTSTSSAKSGDVGLAQQPPVAQSNPLDNCALYSVTRLDPHSAQQGYARLARLAGPGTPEPAVRNRPPAAGRTPHHKPASPPNQTTGGSAVPAVHGAPQGPPPIPLDESLDAGADDVANATAKARRSTTFGRGRRAKYDPEQEQYDKFGRCSVSLNLAQLFTRKSVIERLSEPTASVPDLFVSVSLDRELLSDTQKRELNPLVIRIKSSKGMPHAPGTGDYETLDHSCEPVYCQYQFFDLPSHRTVGKPHGPEVFWDDIQIVLLGLLVGKSAALWEYLSGGPGTMPVEVHDRDKRPPADALAPALFGNDLEDEKICNTGVVTAKRTLHSAFDVGGGKSWDPYGVSRVSFEDLLNGAKYVSLILPINPCPLPDVLGTEKDKDGKIVGVAGAVDGPKEPPFTTGKYLESGAVLNISLELHCPLVKEKKLETDIAQFGRLLFRFSADNPVFLQRLKSMLKQINAEALHLTGGDHVISTALRNYKLPFGQRKNPQLNLITGFHIMDPAQHLLVIEGPKTQAIQSLWLCLSRDNAKEGVHVFYNNKCGFADRLYADLEVDFAPIRLDDSLEEITKQPLLYVRDMVPKACFEGISRLHQLSQSTSLLGAINNDLFPTAPMILAVSREFGIPVNIIAAAAVSETAAAQDGVVQSWKTPLESGRQTNYVSVNRWTKQLDNFNDKYIRRMVDSGARPATNFIHRNIRFVHLASASVQNNRSRSCPVGRKLHSTDPSSGPHNYSSQTRAASELAKRELIENQLEPGKLYTYSERFQSATFSPADPEKERKVATAQSRARWQSHHDWTYPGVRTAIHSNRPAKGPDEATTEDLRHPWVENQLHAALLQPSVPGRQPFDWGRRGKDFDLYGPAPEQFGCEPHTIMPAGVLKEAEAALEARKQLEVWCRKVVVNDPQIHMHRCLPQTELVMHGAKSSNQIDRLRGLRKDSPQKFGLVDPGYEDPPAIAVLKDPGASSGVEPTRSFSPGEDPRRVSLLTAYVPRTDGKRGLKLVHRSHDQISLRHIKPLTPSERANNLFAGCA